MKYIPLININLSRLYLLKLSAQISIFFYIQNFLNHLVELPFQNIAKFPLYLLTYLLFLNQTSISKLRYISNFMFKYLFI